MLRSTYGSSLADATTQVTPTDDVLHHFEPDALGNTPVFTAPDISLLDNFEVRHLRLQHEAFCGAAQGQDVSQLKHAMASFLTADESAAQASPRIAALLCVPYIISRLGAMCTQFVLTLHTAGPVSKSAHRFVHAFSAMYPMWTLMVDNLFGGQLTDTAQAAQLFASTLYGITFRVALQSENPDLMDACAGVIACLVPEDDVVDILPDLTRSVRSCLGRIKKCYAAFWGSVPQNAVHAALRPDEWGTSKFESLAAACQRAATPLDPWRAETLVQRLQTPLAHKDMQTSPQWISLFLSAPWRSPIPMPPEWTNELRTIDAAPGRTVAARDVRRDMAHRRAAEGSIASADGFEDVEDARARIATTYPEVSDIPSKALPLCALRAMRADDAQAPVGDWKNEDRYMIARFSRDVGDYDIEDLAAHFSETMAAADPEKAPRRMTHFRDTLRASDRTAAEKEQRGYAPLASHSCKFLIDRAQKQGSAAPRFACPYAQLAASPTDDQRTALGALLEAAGVHEEPERARIIERTLMEGPRAGCIAHFKATTGARNIPPGYPVLYTHKATLAQAPEDSEQARPS